MLNVIVEGVSSVSERVGTRRRVRSDFEAGVTNGSGGDWVVLMVSPDLADREADERARFRR
jgi:hypothetical protein